MMPILKTSAKTVFRENILQLLYEEYTFFLTPHDNIAFLMLVDLVSFRVWYKVMPVGMLGDWLWLGSLGSLS